MKHWRWLLFVLVIGVWGSLVYVVFFNRAVDYYMKKWGQRGY